MGNNFLMYICGFFSYAAISSLYQDWIGKDAYIEKCQNEWISPHITVPFALILLILVFPVVLKIVKGE